MWPASVNVLVVTLFNRRLIITSLSRAFFGCSPKRCCHHSPGLIRHLRWCNSPRFVPACVKNVTITTRRSCVYVTSASQILLIPLKADFYLSLLGVRKQSVRYWYQGRSKGRPLTLKVSDLQLWEVTQSLHSCGLHQTNISKRCDAAVCPLAVYRHKSCGIHTAANTWVTWCDVRTYTSL